MTSDEIVDSHIHLFGRGGRSSYGLGDLATDIQRSGHAVTRAVYVECGQGYRTDGPEHLRPVGETDTVIGAIEAARGTGPDIAGIVAYADLSGPHLDEVLDAHEAAGRGLFKGIRQATAYDEDPSVPHLPQDPPADLMERDEFRAGLAVLGGRRLSYDAYLYHPQLSRLAEAARAVPETTIILNHLGAPLAVGRHADRQSEVIAAWRDGITELGECPNVAVKIGGLGMPFLGFGRIGLATPASGQVAAACSPAVSHVLGVFGADRCLAESNFPIDRATCTYGTIWDAITKLLGDLSSDARRQVLSETAARLYRL